MYDEFSTARDTRVAFEISSLILLFFMALITIYDLKPNRIWKGLMIRNSELTARI